MPMPARRTLAVVMPITLASLTAAGHARADVLSDNFDDNATGPQWSTVIDSPATLTLAEQNQRLELIADAPTSSATDALYLSNGPAGFRLSTAADFHLTLAYSFTGYQDDGDSGDALALDFGVGRDLDGTDSAAIGVGYYNLGPLKALGGLVAHRTGDAETQDALGAPASTGVFDIAYDWANDDLTLSVQGGGLSYTLQDTVRGVWGADALYVSFGGRGDGFTLASGDAWLDDFAVVSGQTLPVPEPASAALLGAGLGALAMGRRRRA